MIRVQKKQLDGVRRTLAREGFEQRMVVHLREFAPRLAEVLGDDGLQGCVSSAIERARSHGVTTPGLVRFYLDCTLKFGARFDDDPLLPWAGAVLGDASIADETVRIRRLHEAMLRYLEAIGGAARPSALQTLRDIKRAFAAPLSAADPRFSQKAVDTLTSIDPGRCAYLGEPPLVELVRRGAEQAARHGVATDRGIVLVTGMMFVIGHGFAEDPTLPWIAATLREESRKAPEERVRSLQRRAEIYLDRAVDYLEERADVRV